MTLESRLRHGFISYAHDDHQIVQRFITHLKQFERSFNLSFWSDNRIEPGERWSSEIQGAIEAADVFLLMMSPGFIASDYIFSQELPAIKKQRLDREALVIPVLLRSCYWHGMIDALQAVPTKARRLMAISQWETVRKGIERSIDEISSSLESKLGMPAQYFSWEARS